MWKPNVLVIGPGGTRGFIFLGSLSILEREEFLTEITTYVGVSIGALISFFLVLGYTVEEVVMKSVTLDMVSDMDGLTVNRIISNKGLITYDRLKVVLKEAMMEKLGKEVNLRELHEITGKNFTTISFDTGTLDSHYFSHETDPECMVSDAILASVSIPYLFQEFRYNGAIHVDGAFGDPVPISKFDKEGNELLVLNIFTQRQPVSSTIEVLPKLVTFLIDKISKLSIENASKRVKILALPTTIIGVMSVSISQEDKINMIDIGKNYAHRFIRELKESGEIHVYVNPCDIPLPPDVELETME